MTKHYDICIIGAGSAGLTMAAVSANLGHKVALIEGHKMGGDCLNYGCVPSKALLASAKQGEVNFKQAIKNVHTAIKTIAPHDSVERFEGFGVDVYKNTASFEDKYTVKAGKELITAKRFVIATGASAFTPPIPGLKNTPYLTNESIFNLNAKPEHLVIIGGGAVGVEMAFAFNKLGSKVTLLEVSSSILPSSDRDAVNVLRKKLMDDGVAIKEGIHIDSIKHKDKSFTLSVNSEDMACDALLVATGRRANIQSLNLGNADVEFTDNGINVDKTLRTNKKHIYAVGDCSSKYQFTHAASFEASLVIKRTLFGLFRSKINYNAMPKVIYTSPELAETGISEQEAISLYGSNNISIVTKQYKDLDRAICENKTTGFAKIILNSKGYVLGACIVGELAGELITPWTTLIQHKRKISDLSAVTVPYPTYSELNKQLASEYYKESFYSSKVQKISKWLFKFLG